MGFTAKAKSSSSSSSSSISSSSENWGMGLLLVLFPEDNSSAIVDKSNKLVSSSSSSSSPSSSSSSSSKTCTPTTSFRRSNSNNLLLNKAQSTISICALLVFITLLLFTLSTFEPTSKTHPIITITSRRFLSQKSSPINTNPNLPKPINKPNANNTNPNSNPNPNPNPNPTFSLLSSSWFSKMWKQKQPNPKANPLISRRGPFALQRMGTLFRRGTRAMADLVVGHVADDVTADDLRLFLRLLHRSGLTSKADVAFVFASSSARFAAVIEEENDSFFKLLHHYKQLNGTSRKPGSGFDVTQFLKPGKKELEEPLWGKKSVVNSEGEAELTQLSYGSVVGFEVGELDPENSLAGFLDHAVPMGLRRWACYPMLLGRVRRNFKHIMLVDVKNSVVLGDPLGRVRHRSPESVLLFTMPAGKHGKKNSDPTQSHGPVNSGVITGGSRGIRRLSSTVLTEIVRATMQRKKKSLVTESGILGQLVSNAFVSKNINLVVTSTESVPDPSSLGGADGLAGHSIIQRGNSNNRHDLNSIIMKQICLLEIDSCVYRDCLETIK